MIDLATSLVAERRWTCTSIRLLPTRTREAWRRIRYDEAWLGIFGFNNDWPEGLSNVEILNSGRGEDGVGEEDLGISSE